MTDDNPIISEIRATRERLLAEHQGDLNRLIDELQQMSIQTGSDAAEDKSKRPTGHDRGETSDHAD